MCEMTPTIADGMALIVVEVLAKRGLVLEQRGGERLTDDGDRRIPGFCSGVGLVLIVVGVEVPAGDERHAQRLRRRVRPFE